jgi:uncharacterized membrane protein HdeD (DUF308 family)
MKLTLYSIASYWRLVLLRGLIAITFGLVAFALPGMAPDKLVVLFGIYALFDGIVAGVATASSRGPVLTWYFLLLGVAGIAAGIIAIAWYQIGPLTLLGWIGVWTIVRGTMEIAGTFWLRGGIENTWQLLLSGLLSVIFGLVLIARPGACGVIAAYSIVVGALLVGFSLRLHGLRERIEAGGMPGLAGES